MENQIYEDNNQAYEENDEEFAAFLALLSGQNEEGKPNATISYQCYAVEDPEDAPSKKVSYPLTTPWAQMWIDKLHPEYVGVDIAFRSFDDTELRLLYGRMNRHLQNMSKSPEKTWVFYFNILSNEGLKRGSEKIVMAHVMNPSIFFLTRQSPTQECENRETDYGLTGGNIIRMLVPIDLVSIEVADGASYGLENIRAEVQREMEEAEFLDASAESADAWNEEDTTY